MVAEQSITKRLDLAPGHTAAHLAKSECGEKARQKEGRGGKSGTKSGTGATHGPECLDHCLPTKIRSAIFYKDGRRRRGDANVQVKDTEKFVKMCRCVSDV